MPEPHVTSAHAIWEIIKYPLVVMMGFFGWNLKRQVGRVDKIESEYVSEKTFNETLKSLRSDISSGFSEVRTDVRGIHSRIDKIKDHE